MEPDQDTATAQDTAAAQDTAGQDAAAQDAGETPDPDLSWWLRRWRGQKGRLEVWYATMTDTATGAGFWVHGETVAPTGEVAANAPTSHGWAAYFPADAPPTWARSAMVEVDRPDEPEAPAPGRRPGGFAIDGLRIDTTGTAGVAGDLAWHLDWDVSTQTPLATFPSWAWNGERLPAAQVVPAPSMTATGWVEHAGERHPMEGHAQCAHIYGHGNANRWAWLHADLGGGDLVELVTAVSTRPGLRKLAPITFLRMRVGGYDWPTTRIASWGLTATLDLPVWRVRGTTQGVKVDIQVTQPPERCVSIDYVDPDGATATCTNSERADLRLSLSTPDIGERVWEVAGTAHAEVGTRP